MKIKIIDYTNTCRSHNCKYLQHGIVEENKCLDLPSSYNDAFVCSKYISDFNLNCLYKN